MSLSLFIVFVFAKLLILWGRELPSSPWVPVVYIWQDAAIAIAFHLFSRVVRREWAARVVYAGLILLVAVNVPVARVLSSPLTAPMIRAARGTLADSIRYHATASNVASVVAVLVMGAALPRLLSRSVRFGRIAFVAGGVVMFLGVATASRVDTGGLERNPLVALLRSFAPRVDPKPHEADWRNSFFGTATSEDLSYLRGVAKGRSVLLVVLESTAARYLRAYGASEDPTPHLTAFAKRSIVFENAYAVYPESIKGLVATLASRYPGFDVPAERHASIVSPSLATSLANAGYVTGLVHSGRLFYLGMDTIVERCGFSRVADAGDIGGHRDSSFGVDEGAAVSHLLQWMDTLPPGKPFFAAYLPIAGHHPYTYATPGPFSEREEIGRYRSALHEGDRALGDLFNGLRERGLDRSTVVVVLGDHGEAFGQHEGNYGHTLALYEENVRVPLMMSVPGSDAASRRVRRVASLIDLAPTVLDLLGIAPPRQFQGESLLNGRTRAALFFTDYSLGLLGLRDGCMKYIFELESHRSKLFDLCRDPDERVNLSEELPNRTIHYRERLRLWSSAQVARIR